MDELRINDVTPHQRKNIQDYPSNPIDSNFQQSLQSFEKQAEMQLHTNQISSRDLHTAEAKKSRMSLIGN